MTNLNAAAIDAAVVAMKINAGFDETETDDDPIWREEAETAVSAYLAALPEGSVMVPVVDIEQWVVAASDCKSVNQWPMRGVESEYRFPWMEKNVTVTKLQSIDDWLRALLPAPEAAR